MDLSKFVKNLEKEMKKAGDGSYSFEELFTNEFLTEQTEFDNIENFLENSPFDFNGDVVALDEIDDPKLDEYISKNSNFDDFSHLLKTAAQAAAAERLRQAGFDIK